MKCWNTEESSQLYEIKDIKQPRVCCKVRSSFSLQYSWKNLLNKELKLSMFTWSSLTPKLICMWWVFCFVFPPICLSSLLFFTSHYDFVFGLISVYNLTLLSSKKLVIWRSYLVTSLFLRRIVGGGYSDELHNFYSRTG